MPYVYGATAVSATSGDEEHEVASVTAHQIGGVDLGSWRESVEANRRRKRISVITALTIASMAAVGVLTVGVVKFLVKNGGTNHPTSISRPIDASPQGGGYPPSASAGPGTKRPPSTGISAGSPPTTTQPIVRPTSTTTEPPPPPTTVQIVEVPFLMYLSVQNAVESLNAVGLRLGTVTTYVSDGLIDECDPNSFSFPPRSGDVASSSVENNINGSYVPVGSKVDLVVCP
jgi:hypothetical protein